MMLGLSLATPNILRRGSNIVSGATTLLGSETQGLSLDFTDSYHLAASSQYGSARIIDTGTPANNYDSHPYGLLTYTSPSVKMTLGPTGTYRYGAHNLCLQSETLENATWTKNQLQAFGSGSVADAIANSLGAMTADLIVPNTVNTNHFVAQTITVISGQSYIFEFEAKAQNYGFAGSFGVNLGFNEVLVNLSTGAVTRNDSSVPVTVTDRGNGWWRISITGVASSTSGTVRIYASNSGSSSVFAGDGTSGIYATRAHFRVANSDTTYLATTSSARYALPFEWNTSGALQGILVEEARTNLLQRSEEFANVIWVEQDVSAISEGTTVAPDGSQTADTLTATATNSVHNVYYNNATIVSGTTYALSCFVKKNTSRYVVLNFQGFGANNYVSAVFDLDGGGSTATQTSVGSISGTLVSTGQTTLPNGWYRLSVVGNMAVTAAFPNIGVTNAATGNTFNTSGQISFNAAGTESIFIWGAQLEAGSFPTSYMQTFGATVTRAADNITLLTSTFPLSATAGTFYVRYTTANVTAERRAIELNDTTANERFTLGNNSSAAGALWVVDGGANQTAPLTTGTVVAGTVERLAASWAANDFALSSDGGAAATDTSGTLPTVTTLRLGAGVGGVNVINGYLSQALYLPRAMSDAELATRST